MKIFHFLTCCVSAAFLFACVAPSQQIRLQVVGRMDDGTPMQGTNIADTGPAPGRFEVFTTDGLSCSGTYDDMDPNPTLRIPVTCSDGSAGTVIATRDRTLLSGTAIAELDNGRSAEFMFGNLSANQQAAFLTQTK